ncbi:MAG: hypothetical protein HYZ49_19040 [Chloroflexi bacterium]|nr:hypothetical protein [Chloroflexota bacterium]
MDFDLEAETKRQHHLLATHYGDPASAGLLCYFKPGADCAGRFPELARLTSQGMSALYQLGESPYPASEDIAHCYTGLIATGHEFTERYQAQTHLRQAWLDLLQSRHEESAAGAMPLCDRALLVIGRERFCLHPALKFFLGVSAMQASHAKEELLQAGLIREHEVAVTRRQSARVYTLSANGFNETQALGQCFKPAPSPRSVAMQERLLHQQTVMLYLMESRTAETRRVFTEPGPSPIPSPLGVIMPDIEIVYPDGQQHFVEVEADAHDYGLPLAKLDKYLASAVDEVWLVISGNIQRALLDVERWGDERRRKRPPRMPADPRLCIHVASLSHLQRFGPGQANWQTYLLWLEA